MMKNSFLFFFIDAVTAVVLFLFIFSFSVTFTLNFRPLYYMDIKLLDIEARSGIAEDEIRENYDALIEYNSIFTEEELVFPTLAMSETGKIHFEEVKVIFVLFQKMALVTGVLGLAAVLWQRRCDRRRGAEGDRCRGRWLKLAGVLTIVLPAILAAAMAINWDKAFVLFHKIAFDNDYWIFDAATDPVITILPDTFFFHCAAMIVAMVVAGSVLCLCLYARLSRKHLGKNV